MSETTYYQKNRDVILDRAKKYENNKKILKDKTRDKYRELSEEEKKYKKRIWKKQISLFVLRR